MVNKNFIIYIFNEVHGYFYGGHQVFYVHLSVIHDFNVDNYCVFRKHNVALDTLTLDEGNFFHNNIDYSHLSLAVYSEDNYVSVINNSIYSLHIRDNSVT